MSNKAINWAYNEVRGIGLAAKAVLVKLADQANDDGFCWLGKDSMSAQLDCDKRTVDRAIEKLVALGLITVKLGVPKLARTKTERNIYYLQMEQRGLFGLEVVGERRPDMEQIGAKGVAECQGWQSATGGDGAADLAKGVAESPKKGGTVPPEPLENPLKRNPNNCGPADAGPDEFYISAKGKKLSGPPLRRFEEFWAFWGRHGNKAPTADAWLLVEKYHAKSDAGWERRIIQAARAEAKRREAEPDTPAKMAQGWLTERRWEDHRPPPSSQSSNAEPQWFEQWPAVIRVAGDRYGILGFDFPEPVALLAELIKRMEAAEHAVPGHLRNWLKSIEEAA